MFPYLLSLFKYCNTSLCLFGRNFSNGLYGYFRFLLRHLMAIAAFIRPQQGDFVLNELLAQAWVKIQSTEHVSFLYKESDTQPTDPSTLIRNGMFVWVATTLEKASAVLDESSFKRLGGRLLKAVPIILSDPRGFNFFLETLDEVDDSICDTLSSADSNFKGLDLLSELHRILCVRHPEIWRSLSPLYSSLLTSEMSVDTVRFLRHQSNLLSKLQIDRSDVLSRENEAYLYDEFLSRSETSAQRSGSRDYEILISEVRHVLEDVIKGFNSHDVIPKHGPGAVSDSSIKSKVLKYKNIGFDPRIDYMLRKTSLYSYTDFCPLGVRENSRVSRTIFVPKTWKKLRGISAEPVELQYFQQGVLKAIMASVSRSSLNQVIDLSDQEKSRSLALKGSLDGSLATIDLSAASDSVTLQLVKDVFGTSELCRWLLATRSTHTIIGDKKLELSKFAPMGSACCFPIECLLFAGIAIASCNIHSRGRMRSIRNFRVYGDDIICPSIYADVVMEALYLCGFTVNPSKSFTQGDFRESCGMDAWRGFDVTPLKLKDFSFDFDGPKPLSYEHQSRICSYLNTLYSSGYCKTRSFLLKKFLASSISLKGTKVSSAKSVYFGDGSRGSLFSPYPTNFHLNVAPVKGYQRFGYESVGWRVVDRLKDAFPEDRNVVNYYEYLVSKTRSDTPEPIIYDLEFFKNAKGVRNTEALEPRMVPTFRVIDPLQWD